MKDENSVSSAGLPFMETVLGGVTNTLAQWDEYVRTFHEHQPEANELFTLLLTAGGQTSYDMLGRAVAAHGAQRVLDLGCGEGNFADAFRLHCSDTAHLTGVDICLPEIEIARRRYASEPRITFDCADAYALPYPDASYDVVVSHQMMNFASDPRALIVESARVLAPGGWLIVASNRGWRRDRENTWIYLDQAARSAVDALYPKFAWPVMGDRRMYDANGLLEIFSTFDMLDISTFAIEEFSVGAFMSPQHLAAIYNRLYVYGSIPERSAIHDAVITRARELADPRNLVGIELPFRLIAIRKKLELATGPARH